MSIDRTDSGLQNESKYSALKNLVYEEFNDLNHFIQDLGLEYTPCKLE